MTIEHPSETPDPNQFTIDNIVLDDFSYPQLIVKTWRDIFEGQVSVVAEAAVIYRLAGGGSTPSNVTIFRGECAPTDDITELRAEVQRLANDFNEDRVDNWNALLRKSLTKVANYYQKQIDEIDTVRAKRDATLAKITTLRPGS